MAVDDLRARSCGTKVFHAAIIGRGSEVEMTVSSISLTRPTRMSSPTTKTGA